MAPDRPAQEFAVLHDENLGKGAALRDGIHRAITHGASVVVTLDADGQHPPEESRACLKPIAEGKADWLLGARKARRSHADRPPAHDWLSATLASRIGGQPVRDAQTGFRAFTREVAERVQPAGDRYEYEANFLLDALRAGYRVVFRRSAHNLRPAQSLPTLGRYVAHGPRVRAACPFGSSCERRESANSGLQR